MKKWFSSLTNEGKRAIPKDFNLNTSNSSLSFQNVLNNAINDLFPAYQKFSISLPTITNPTAFNITNNTVTGTITVGGWPIKLSIKLN